MELNLRKTDDGIVQLITTTQTQEVPYSPDEIKRQISEHAAVIETLECQLKTIQSFEQSDDTEATVQIEAVTKPLIDKTELEAMVAVKAEVADVPIVDEQIKGGK